MFKGSYQAIENQVVVNIWIRILHEYIEQGIQRILKEL